MRKATNGDPIMDQGARKLSGSWGDSMLPSERHSYSGHPLRPIQPMDEMSIQTWGNKDIAVAEAARQQRLGYPHATVMHTGPSPGPTDWTVLADPASGKYVRVDGEVR